MKNSLNNQKADTEDLDPYYSRHKHEKILDTIFLLLVGVLFGMLILSAARALDRVGEQMPKPNIVYIKCYEDKKVSMTEYFKKAGNKTPQQMAEAVLSTNSPRLLAAISVAGEKNTCYKVRNGGYKKQHHGAWQVNPKYWGPVPHDPVGQAQQAEDILTDLTNNMSIKKALDYYGGDSTNNYSERVLAELVNVPR